MIETVQLTMAQALYCAFSISNMSLLMESRNQILCRRVWNFRSRQCHRHW